MTKGRDAGLTFGLGLLLLFQVPNGLAQQPSAASSGKWMLEIVQAKRAPEYFQMGEGYREDQADVVVIRLHADHDTSRARPSGLEFRYWMQGTAVTVRVSLRFDSAASRSSSEKELQVGSYVVHPGQSITVSQLSQFGVQTVQLRMVTAKPPGAAQPEIVNETSSMVVENVDQDRAEYRLSLRNTSELAAHAMAVSVFDGEGRCTRHDFHSPSGNLAIPSGKIGEFPLSFPIAADEGGVVGADGLSCSHPPQGVGGSAQKTNPSETGMPEIVIEAVDFEDGSYEGDPQKAAMLEAQRLGRKIERTLVTTVVERQLASSEADGMAQLACVQSQVKDLSDEVDPAGVKSIMARFTTVPDSAKESIKRDIHDGLLMEKGMFLRNLRWYVFELSKGLAANPSLQRWWDLTKGRCDFLAPLTCPGSD
ncbi:MAG: hypothetical protein ACRD3T_07335 [Terriglobia bacterium]